MTPLLFSPLQLGPIEVPNRIAVAPMCQYSADDGSATRLAPPALDEPRPCPAPGLVVVEATAVERHGRISHGCLGLYSDANEAPPSARSTPPRRVALPGTKFGVQLAHAGRKASCQRPWEGGGPLKADQDPWQTIAPSAIPMGTAGTRPSAMDEADFARVKQAFVDCGAPRRSAPASTCSNCTWRTAISCTPSCRRSPTSANDALWPRRRRTAVLPRRSRAGGAKPPCRSTCASARGSSAGLGRGRPDRRADGVALARRAKEVGVAYACVSSGGGSPHQKIPVGPGYQVHLAAEVKREPASPPAPSA